MKKLIIKSTGKWLNLLSYIAPKICADKGFRLFCNPFARKLKPFHIDFLKTGELFDFTFENKKVQGYKWGNGARKVLLLHGWASNTFRWKKLIESLQNEDVTIYAFDAPAHGLSEGKMLHVVKYYNCLLEFFNKFGYPDSIISHSIGGFTTLYTFFKEPQLNSIKAVVMAAPGEASDFLSFYQKTLSLNNRATRLISNKFIDYIGNPPYYYSTRLFSQSIKNNILLIHDKNDRDTNYQYSEQLSKTLVSNKLIFTEGLGHNLKSDELNKEIVNFVRG